MARMAATQILAALAGLGLLVSVGLIPLRMGWGRAGVAAPASGGWWILSLVAIAFWSFALTAGPGLLPGRGLAPGRAGSNRHAGQFMNEIGL